MAKFGIVGLVSASKYLGEIEAKSAEEARDKGWFLADSPNICYQCSKEVDIGDIYEIEVYERK